MTEFEKTQSRETFIEAGERSFRMGILPGNNPYTETPYKEFWMRGYKEAEDKSLGRAQRKFVPNTRPGIARLDKSRMLRFEKTPAPKFAQHVGRVNRVPTPRPVISLGKLNHFNHKHQTQTA